MTQTAAFTAGPYGAEWSFTVPANVRRVTVWVAGGEGSTVPRLSGVDRNPVHVFRSVLPVEPGDVLSGYLGEAGGWQPVPIDVFGSDPWNALGGRSGPRPGPFVPDGGGASRLYGGGGGAATVVYLNGDRILIAAGGGGCSWDPDASALLQPADTWLAFHPGDPQPTIDEEPRVRTPGVTDGMAGGYTSPEQGGSTGTFTSGEPGGAGGGGWVGGAAGVNGNGSPPDDVVTAGKNGGTLLPVDADGGFLVPPVPLPDQPDGWVFLAWVAGGWLIDEIPISA